MGEIISEEVRYNRYLTVFDREVEFTTEQDGGDGEATTSTRIKYDIVGHPKNGFQFAVVFPFHPATSDRQGMHHYTN